MRARYPYLPHVLSALALTVALAGVTPADAVSTVKRALFAKNAGAVDGISASRTPSAGKLVPLDATAKLPSAVLPTGGSRGLRGPQGPEGQTGPPGPVEALTTKLRTTAVPLAGNQSVEGSRLLIGPGKWMVLASGSGVWDPASGGVYLACQLAVGAKAIDGNTSRLGSDAAAAIAMPFSLHGVVDVPATTTARVSCFHDQNVTGAMRVEGVHITALRVDRFSEQAGDGT